LAKSTVASIKLEHTFRSYSCICFSLLCEER
jgi:hypothetical protein